ncbi:MAG: B12-binding domain-containing radical SAM protein [Eubacterium sp.]|nr:B12-binding domain-containing radical SAM protein [Eubacterium sp.]
MKFLLVALNAKYIHSNPAIYSLRAFAGKEMEKHIELAEYTINQQVNDILADIYQKKPDAIAFSCYIWNWKEIQELLTEIPKVLPKTDLWLGGPEVTYGAEKLLKQYPQVTGVMIGEGEVTFRETVREYLEEKDFSKVAGLCLKEGYTKPRELTDLTELPFLYGDLEPFENKIIYYESSRGCPYRCSYCLSSIDKKVRLRNLDVVKKELQFFLDRKVKQVKFVDRTFNCNHQHAMEIWKYLLEHDNGVTNFHFEVSADILNDEEIALLNQLRPGLAQLEIGVQSTNEETLRAINRTMNVERLEGIVAAIRAGGNIHQHLDLIAGLPYEDYESFQRSFNRVYEMKPDQLQLGFLKVLKGSEMEQRAREFGICYGSQPPYEVLYTNWLSFDEVLFLKKVEEMVELYYNSDQFEHVLPFLVKTFDSPFAMFEQLAKYYEEQGYFLQSPARSYRYQVLLNFALEYDAEHADIYKELLTYDLYLRENVKSRPGFCKDLTTEAYRTFASGFYKTEEEQREYLPQYQEYHWKQLWKMTHLEVFDYPVWDIELLIAQGRLKEPQGILFDYKDRNPLNYEARTVRI